MCATARKLQTMNTFPAIGKTRIIIIIIIIKLDYIKNRFNAFER